MDVGLCENGLLGTDARRRRTSPSPPRGGSVAPVGGSRRRGTGALDPIATTVGRLALDGGALEETHSAALNASLREVKRRRLRGKTAPPRATSPSSGPAGTSG